MDERRRVEPSIKLVNSKLNNSILFQTQLSSTRRLLFRSNQSNHNTTLLDADYAAHGVLHSLTPVDYTSDNTISVGVIAFQWPAWSIPFMQPRFSLLWIIIIDPMWIPIIQTCFPKCLILHIDSVDFDILPRTDIIGFNGPIQDITLPPSFCCICVF